MTEDRRPEMTKARRVATNIILGVWTVLALIAFVMIVALIV